MAKCTQHHKFEKSTRRYIAEHALLHSGAPVIVALSGGADSVALLACLSALGYQCVAAHCNFHLRGEESRRDMLHAAAVADKLGVDFCMRDFNVGERVAQTGESVEMACRELRYRWFADLADSTGAQAITVGHHSEDRSETFLLNLFRGAGIVGLTSMNPRNEAVVRPLLWATRIDVEMYLADKGLDFITDSSNASDVHRRNRIRNRLMPLMEELFPGAHDSILRTITNLESVRRILEVKVSAVAAEVTASDGSIDLVALSRYDESATLLMEMLRGRGFTVTQVRDMISGADSSGLRFSGSCGLVAEIDRGRLSFTEEIAFAAAVKSYPVDLHNDILEPLHIAVSAHPVADFKPEKNMPTVAYIDSDYALSANDNWVLRHWKRGDRITPYGSSKSKLVSDIFANAKYSASDKREAWLLCRNDEIVWIVGLRNSAAGAIGSQTKNYLRLQLVDKTKE